MELESIDTVLTPFCHIIYQTFSRKCNHIIGPIITTRPVQPPSPPRLFVPATLCCRNDNCLFYPGLRTRSIFIRVQVRVQPILASPSSSSSSEI